MSLIRFVMYPICVLTAIAAAQESRSTTSVVDFQGRRSDWSSSQAGDSSTRQVITSLNGTRVPVEQTEEKVLLKEAGRTVVERMLRRYSADGRPLPPEKTLIETAAGADGRSIETVTVFRGDLNGSLVAAERSVTHSVTSGSQVKSETSLERASINGSFAAVERRSATTSSGDNRSETNTIVYRPDANGRMAEAAQLIVRAATQEGVTTEQSEEYENASTGKMQLRRQSIARTVKNADGTERREVDIFGNAAPGRAISSDGGMQLRERQVFDRRPENGRVVEKFSVQRPSLDDSRKLTAPQLVSETVCQGKCK